MFSFERSRKRRALARNTPFVKHCFAGIKTVIASRLSSVLFIVRRFNAAPGEEINKIITRHFLHTSRENLLRGIFIYLYESSPAHVHTYTVCIHPHKATRVMIISLELLSPFIRIDFLDRLHTAIYKSMPDNQPVSLSVIICNKTVLNGN